MKVRYDTIDCDDPQAELLFIEGIDGNVDSVPIEEVYQLRPSPSPSQLSHSPPISSINSSHGPNSLGELSLLENGSWKPSQPSIPLLDPSTRVWRRFKWRHVHFWYNAATRGWHKFTFAHCKGLASGIHSVGKERVTETDGSLHNSRLTTYGPNSIEIGVDSLFSLFLQQLLTPFVLFQVYSSVIWVYEQYWVYASVIIGITLLSSAFSALQAHKNQKRLQNLAKLETEVKKARFTSSGWEYKKCGSTELVPGDVILVSDKLTCPCDLILLSGQCVVNEAMLTGESAPIVKDSLPLDGTTRFDQRRDARYMLLSGSKVIQAKQYSFLAGTYSHDLDSVRDFTDLASQTAPVLALVLNTGSSTAKGKLIQAIQYPQAKMMFSHKQKEEATVFVIALTVVMLIGVCCYVITAVMSGTQTRSQILVYSFDATTILIPAALPLALSVGVVVAFTRLQEKGVNSTSHNHINIAGHVDCVCYDKTGTLTNGTENFVGASVALKEGSKIKCQPLCMNIHQIQKSSPEMEMILAACHNLTVIQQTATELHCGKDMVGDGLELEMFKASNWILCSLDQHHPHFSENVLCTLGLNGNKWGNFMMIAKPSAAGDSGRGADALVVILKVFQFQPDLRMMSTCVMHKSCGTSHYLILSKGGPEAVKTKCRADSIPWNFDKQLLELTASGYRVLGCAYRKVDMDSEQILHASRDDCEKDLTFCGFLVMGNRLKPESIQALNEIKSAGLRQCMVTGDNIFTAIAVAKECSVFVTENKPDVYVIQQNGESEELGLGSLILEMYSFQAGRKLTHNRVMSFQDFYEDHSALGAISFTLAVSGSAYSILLQQYENILNELQDRRRTFSWQNESTKDEDNSPFKFVLKTASIFARFRPHEKQSLMSNLQKLTGRYVCMVGDGANDSFALKTADVGISIANSTEFTPSGQELMVDTEASAPSIAAPFSTSTSHIGVVPLLLCEGRCALATSIIAFRYMLQYGVILFCSTMILYFDGLKLGDLTYLWGDLFIVLPLSIQMGLTGPGKRMVPGIPESRLMHWKFIFGILGHSALAIIPQILIIWYLKRQSFWTAAQNDSTVSMEGTVLFWMTSFQYVFASLSVSHDYQGLRGRFVSNKAHTFTSIALLLANSLLVIFPKSMASAMLELVESFPFKFRIACLTIFTINGMLFFCFEYLFMPKKHSLSVT